MSKINEILDEKQLFAIQYAVEEAFNKNFKALLEAIDKIKESSAHIEPKEVLQEAVNKIHTSYMDFDYIFEHVLNEKLFKNFYCYIDIENINDYAFIVTAFYKKERYNIAVIHLTHNQMEDLDAHLEII